MQQTHNSSLYLLVFPEQGFLKIGKANNTHVRCQTLKKWWGKADYSKSFELTASSKTISRLEKSLHFLLSAHNANAPPGDGYTEMFLLSALDLAIEHIELFSKSSAVPFTLKNGIVVSSKEIEGKEVSKLVNFKIPMRLYLKLKYLGDTTYDSSMTKIVVSTLEHEIERLLKDRQP